MLELRNISLVASLIIDASLARKESKGLHFIIDYPAMKIVVVSALAIEEQIKIAVKINMKNMTKVLIVDDEPQNVQVMKEILSFHSTYECRGAKSGEEALAILKSYFPEIILLDVMMPGIDGYEVCRRIR